jgi:hypothetical protein
LLVASRTWAWHQKAVLFVHSSSAVGLDCARYDLVAAS